MIMLGQRLKSKLLFYLDEGFQVAKPDVYQAKKADTLKLNKV